MPVPDLDLLRIRRYIEGRNARIPVSSRGFRRIELAVDGCDVTIVERRAPWDTELAGPEWTRKAIARLRYTPDRRQWSLYWPDRRSRFHVYDRVEASASMVDLLDVIERDPLTVFWD